jgi:hypothetical protein
MSNPDAFTVSNCTYNEIRSILHAEDLVSDASHMPVTRHPLLSKLQTAHRTLLATNPAYQSKDPEVLYLRQYVQFIST